MPLFQLTNLFLKVPVLQIHIEIQLYSELLNLKKKLNKTIYPKRRQYQMLNRTHREWDPNGQNINFSFQFSICGR
jgi:hypothetical protein